MRYSPRAQRYAGPRRDVNPKTRSRTESCSPDGFRALPGARTPGRRGARGRVRRSGAVAASETEDVPHRVDARRPVRHPERGAERAACETVAALRPVRQLDPFPEPAEDDGVIPDRIAGPEGDDADLLRPAGADEALAREDGALREVEPARGGDGLREGERGPARRVLLRVMVDLDPLGFEARIEQASRGRDQLRQHGHPDAHVGGEDGARPGREAEQLPSLLGGESGRTDDETRAPLGRDAHVGEGGGGYGEVEHDVLARARAGEVVSDSDAERRSTGQL